MGVSQARHECSSTTLDDLDARIHTQFVDFWNISDILNALACELEISIALELTMLKWYTLNENVAGVWLCSGGVQTKYKG